VYLIYDYSICPASLQERFFRPGAKKFCPVFDNIMTFHTPKKYLKKWRFIFEKTIDRTLPLL